MGRETYAVAPVSLRNAYTTGPVAQDIDLEAARLQAENSDALGRGLNSGVLGLRGALQNYYANAADALGAEQAAKEAYAAGHHTAELAQAAAPAVNTIGDVHNPLDLVGYAAGKFGQAVPYLAPSIGAGLGARLRGLSEPASFAAGVVANHPIMAGGVVERLNADPETAKMSPLRKAIIANTEGAADAAMFHYIPHTMTGAAVGRGAPVGTLNPLQAARNVGEDALRFGAGQGVAMGGVTALGQGVQTALNPGRDPSHDKGELADAAASGFFGMTPLAVPHAIAAHSVGAAVQQTQPLLSGAKFVGSKVYDAMTPAARAAMDKAAAAGEMSRDAFEAMKPHAEALAGTAKAAYEHAKSVYEDNQAENVLNGGVTPHGTVAAMWDAATQGAAVAHEGATAVGRGISEDMKNFVGAVPTDTLSTALGKVGDFLTDPVKKLVTAGVSDDALIGKLKGATDSVLNSLFEGYGRYVDAHNLDSHDAEVFRAARERHINGGLTDADIAELAPAIKNLGVQEGFRESLNVVNKTLTHVDIPLSKGDYYNKSMRQALTSAGVDKALVDSVVSRINAKTVAKLGVTRAVKEAMDTTGQSGRSSLERAKVQAAVEDAVKEMQGERKRRNPDAPDDPYMGPEYRELVRQHVEDLFADEPAMKNDPSSAEALTDAMLNLVQKAADNAPGYHEASKRMAQLLTDKFGERGAEFANTVQAMAEVRYGGNSPHAKRVGALQENQRSYGTLMADFRKASGSKSASVAEELKAMARDFATAQSKDTTVDVEGRLDELEKHVKAARAAGDLAAATDAQREYNQLVQRGEQPQVNAMEAFKQAYGLDAKKFNSLAPILEAFNRSRVNELPAEGRDQTNTAANHAAEVDLNDHEANQAAANASGEGFSNLSHEDSNEIQAAGQNETGVHGQTEPARFIGTEVLRSGKHNREDVQTPASRHPSADFPEKNGMHAAVAREAHAIYGHKVTEARWTSVVDWAREKAQELGVSEESLLRQAMEKVLAHDKERAGKLPEGSEDRKWIDIRAEMAQDVAGASKPGTAFFDPSGPNRHYGYYKLTHSPEANLSYSAEQIGYYGPRGEGRAMESSDRYAKRISQETGASAAAVKNSLIPVKLADGTTRTVDLARLVSNALTHQAADVTGVGDKKVAGAADIHLKARSESGEGGKYKSTRSVQTAEELLNAVHTVLGALMTGEGMHGADTLGHRSGTGKFHSTTDGRGFLDPSVVVFRDPDTHRAITYGQLSKILGKDPQTGFAMKDRVLMSDADMSKLLPKKDADISKGASNSGAKVDGRPVMNKAVGVEKQNADAAAKGVARGALGDKSINVREVLKHAMAMHGLDTADMNKLSDSHAAALLRSAFVELGIDPTKVFSFKPNSRVREFGDVHLFDRGEYPITLGRLLNHEAMRKDTGLPMGDIPGARIHELKAALDKRAAETSAANERKNSGDMKLEDMTEDAQRERDQKDTYDQRELDREIGDYGDSNRSRDDLMDLIKEVKDETGDPVLADLHGRLGREAALDESKRTSETTTREASEAVIKQIHERVNSLAESEPLPAEKRVVSTHGEVRGELGDTHPSTMRDRGENPQVPVGKAKAKTEVLGTTKTAPKKGTVSGTLNELAQARSRHAKVAAKRKAELQAQSRLERMGGPEARQSGFGPDRTSKARDALTTAINKIKEVNKAKGNVLDLSQPVETEKQTVRGVDVSDVPFSKSTGPKREADAKTRDEIRADLEGEAKRLAGDLIGKLDLSDDGHSFWEKAQKLISVSLSAVNMTDATRHEVWHAVEDFLGGMGEQGQKILTQIYAHTDSKLMRKALEARLAGDEGALSQLDNQRERAAYAFQIFMRDGKLPLHSETRTVWQKIKDWFVSMSQKIGFNNEDKHTEAFFKYLSEGNLVRDMDNPEAVMRALNMTKSDKFVADVKTFTGPLSEAVSTVFGHTSNRLRGIGNEHYSAVADMYEGNSGKGGYTARLQAARQRFGNALGYLTEGLEGEDLKKALSSNKAKELMGNFVDYLKNAGLKQKEVSDLFNKIDCFDQNLVNDNFKEFVNDIVKHGAHDGIDAGEAKAIAQKVADHGYYFDPVIGKLFEGNPKIAEKWATKNIGDLMGRALYEGTKIAERRKAFGEGDSILKETVEKGNAKASMEEKRMMRNYIASFEGTLGEGTISPALKGLMGALATANNIRLLPMAVFSQMLEPVQLAFRKNDMGATFDALFRGIKDMPRTFKMFDKDAVRDKWEKYAEDTGTVAASVMGSVLNAMHNGSAATGWVGKVNDLFFRYNFMEQWNRSMHVAATKNAVEFLIEHSQNPGKHSERFLKELGLEAGDVKVDSEGLLEHSDKIDAAVVQYVNEAMAHPDAGSNPVWMNDPRMQLLAQMKRFSFAHARYVLGRGIKEFKLGNASVLGPAILAVPWMLAADAIRDTVNPMANTDYKNNWGYTDHLVHGIERSGALGRWQFPVDMEQAVSHGNSGLEGALGPTAELFSRLARGAHNGKFFDSLFGNLPGAPMIMPD